MATGGARRCTFAYPVTVSHTHAPLNQATVYLESCLKDYTKLEYLRDCICRKCSLLATSRRLETEYRTLEEAARPEARPTESKKRRLAAVRKMKNRVNAALEEGRIEDDLKDVRLEKVYSDLSTKQAMIARVSKFACFRYLIQ